MLKMMIRRVVCVFAFCAMMTVSTVAFSEMLDKVIVVVNDEVITQREFDRAFTPIQKSYASNFAGEELEKRIAEVRKALLEQMINTKLAISLAKKEKVEVDESELQKRIDQIRSYYGSEEAFLQALDERGTNLTEFRKEIKEQMMAQSVVDREVASAIVITPAEINTVYEENKEKLISPKRVKLRGILVRKGDDPEAAKKKAEDIKARLGKGEDFSEVASKSSEGPYAEKGGDMGFVVKGQLLEEMDEVVFNTEKGKVTDIVESRIGYHIFKIEDIEKSRNLGLDEVSDFLRGQIFRKKFEESLMKWLEEKRKNAYIAYK